MKGAVRDIDAQINISKMWKTNGNDQNRSGKFVLGIFTTHKSINIINTKITVNDSIKWFIDIKERLFISGSHYCYQFKITVYTKTNRCDFYVQ